MTAILRIGLVIGALFIAVYVLRKTRKASVQVVDVIFWMCLAAGLLLLAVFPRIGFWLADVLGVQSPANLVFLIAIGLLLLKLFVLNMEVSGMKNRINALSQECALMEDRLREELKDSKDAKGD